MRGRWDGVVHRVERAQGIDDLATWVALSQMKIDSGSAIRRRCPGGVVDERLRWGARAAERRLPLPCKGT